MTNSKSTTKQTCIHCKGKGYTLSGGVASGGVIMSHKNTCKCCKGNGYTEEDYD